MARIRKQSTSKFTNNQGTNQALKATNLVGQAQATTRSTAKFNAVSDLRKLSSGNLPVVKGIQFGSPSDTGVKSSSSAGVGSEWTGLMKTASSHLASLIGGGFLESGVNSLISSFTSLFSNGRKDEAPLVRFTLPDPQQQSVYVTSGGLSTSASFGNSPQSSPLQGPVYKQADIAQAVKNALLTSSSLNDVIAEI